MNGLKSSSMPSFLFCGYFHTQSGGDFGSNESTELLLMSFQSGTDSNEAALLMTIETFFAFLDQRRWQRRWQWGYGGANFQSYLAF